MGRTTDLSSPGLELRTTERDSVSVVDESVCLCKNCVYGGIQQQSALFHLSFSRHTHPASMIFTPPGDGFALGRLIRLAVSSIDPKDPKGNSVRTRCFAGRHG